MRGVLLAAALVGGCGPSQRPAMHDHAPRHGGVVAMIGMMHLEARATRDGSVRVWLTDLWRRPVPLAGVTGRVKLDAHELPLAPRDDTLEASGPPLQRAEVAVHVRLLRGDVPIEANYILPVEAAAGGAAGVPLEGCVVPAGDGRLPRCELRFPEPVTTIAATADGARLLVAGLGVGVSTWALPEARFAGGLAAAPPIAAPPDAVPHAESANAIAVRPDGTEVVVGIESRLLVYRLPGGELARELPRLPGVVRSLAWSPDGGAILATSFYDDAAHLLDAADGHERRRLALTADAGAVAFSPDGRDAAVGSERGRVAVFDVGSDSPPLTVAPAMRAIDCLGIAAARVLFPGADGVLAWSPRTGEVTALAAAGGPPLRLAVSADQRYVASVDVDRAVRVRDAGSGANIETLVWHRAPVIALAWAGTTLVSADFEGHVALWNPPD